MAALQSICGFLDRFAPHQLAEDWDNVGLLVGRRGSEVLRAMTCLTITPESAAEAVESHVQLIVTHHPLPFRPLKRITDDTTVGRLLLDLIAADIAVYSPHTAFDSAAEGINERLIRAMGVAQPIPLRPLSDASIPFGSGRFGNLPQPIAADALIQRVKTLLKIDHVQTAGRRDRSLSRIAVGCGAAGELLALAVRERCDCLIIGETNFHTALEAKASDVLLLLAGHYPSERFAVEELALVLGDEFPEVEVWASRREEDPLQWA